MSENKISELRTDLENEINYLKMEVRQKQEERRTLKRECELLDERRYRLEDFIDKIKSGE